MAKPSGIKLNLISSLELGAATICFLIALPFGTSAYKNFRTRSAYSEAVGFWTGRDWVKAREQLDICIKNRPETYYPHELLAMCWYNSGDVGKAEGKFKEIASSAELSSHDRAFLADMAQTSIKLIEHKQRKDGTTNDAAYIEGRTKALEQAGKRGFIEARLVKLQTDLDALPVAADEKSRGERGAALESLIHASGELEQAANKNPGSARGMAVLYNTIGVANFERGLMLWDEVTPQERAAAKPGQRIQTAAEFTAKGSLYFLRAMQYKTYWAPPYINFERAMGIKLVEDGMSDAERKQWIEKSLVYDKMRDEHLAFIKAMGGKVEKELPLDKQTNKYIFYCGLGWAYARLAVWDRSRHYLSEAVSPNMGRKQNDGGTAEGAVDRARGAARYWKAYEGYEASNRDSVYQSRKQTKQFYDQALRQSGGDPLRRLRVLNNWSVYLILSREHVIDAREKMQQAQKLLRQVGNMPAYSAKVAGEKLEPVLRANHIRILQLLLQRQAFDKRTKNQFRAELRELGGKEVK